MHFKSKISSISSCWLIPLNTVSCFKQDRSGQKSLCDKESTSRKAEPSFSYQTIRRYISVIVFFNINCVLWSGALTFGYGCTVHVGVDVGAGHAEVDGIYISFIMSVQYIGYLVPYKDKVQLDNWSTVYSTR